MFLNAGGPFRDGRERPERKTNEWRIYPLKKRADSSGESAHESLPSQHSEKPERGGTHIPARHRGPLPLHPSLSKPGRSRRKDKIGEEGSHTQVLYVCTCYTEHIHTSPLHPHLRPPSATVKLVGPHRIPTAGRGTMLPAQQPTTGAARRVSVHTCCTCAMHTHC
ncbi:hypothetical protein L209DRAFT_21228 [Thermothelomyces heterothallicus CBS 203.75]